MFNMSWLLTYCPTILRMASLAAYTLDLRPVMVMAPSSSGPFLGSWMLTSCSFLSWLMMAPPRPIILGWYSVFTST